MEQKTYCGRSCEKCLKKVALNCPGCRVGPGKPVFGDCELAQCCMEKKHSTCQTCVAHHSCALYNNRSNLAELRMKRRSEEDRRQKEKAEHARIMARWLTVLFWLFLPNLIGSVLSKYISSYAQPGIVFFGDILIIASGFVYCIVLFCMSRYEDAYKKSALYLLITCLISSFTLFIGHDGWALALLVGIGAVVFDMLSVYHEFYAHATFFEDVDLDISYNWKLLWKLYLIVNCCIYGSIFVAVLAAPFAVVTIVIGLAGGVLVAVLRLILLYRSAKRADFYRVFVEEH